jgi:aminopeptidase N
LIFVEQVDKINPQNAARLTSAFSTFRRYDAGRQALIRTQLQRLLDDPAISKFTFEIASRSLKG